MSVEAEPSLLFLPLLLLHAGLSLLSLKCIVPRCLSGEDDDG